MPLWSWSYVSWIYLCNQCLSPLKLWVQIQFRWGVLDITLCDKVCQWLATGRWFSMGNPVSSTNKTACHDITEILLKVALNSITLNNYIEHGYIKPLVISLLFSLKVKRQRETIELSPLFNSMKERNLW